MIAFSWLLDMFLTLWATRVHHPSLHSPSDIKQQLSQFALVSCAHLTAPRVSGVPHVKYAVKDCDGVQTRTALYNSILAGSIPAIFDSQLAKVLPFSDVMPWEQLVTLISADSIASSGANVVDLLKVGCCESNLPDSS